MTPSGRVLVAKLHASRLPGCPGSTDGPFWVNLGALWRVSGSTKLMAPAVYEQHGPFWVNLGALWRASGNTEVHGASGT